ncbi:MFS transporter [Bacillus sp. P2(2020)]|uniref:MFS transporter n=2 Tax=Calidifontibacillus erzurumensis TaxID=2741433 RepID=A0A8J8GEY2_9BACI|nr:MFS transporter [Calidifontibacillus erzurumensis]
MMLKLQTTDINKIAASKDLQKNLYKRTLIVVLLSQTLGGAGLAAGISVGALLAKDILGTDSLTGLPTALFTLGSALSAYIVGQIAQTHGRRLSLSFGFLTGGLGALGVVLAAYFHSIIFLFVSLFIYGAGTSTNLQARYAGTDLAKPYERAKAASIAMVATTFGAVVGPNLITPMGKLAEAIYIPALAGPFLLAAVAYCSAGLMFFFFLKPDPLQVARVIEETNIGQQVTPPDLSTEKQVQRIGIITGASILILSQIIMVAIMTMTPIHMEHHNRSLTAVGVVISLHIAAMYLPSLLTGALVDKIGRIKMAIASAVTIAISGIMAAYVPGESVFLLSIALMLLGLGWNFGLITGTAIIVDSTTIHNRPKIQGSIDVGVALGGATGGLLSSVIFAHYSYTALSLIGAYLSLLIVLIIMWVKIKKRVPI